MLLGICHDAWTSHVAKTSYVGGCIYVARTMLCCLYYAVFVGLCCCQD